MAKAKATLKRRPRGTKSAMGPPTDAALMAAFVIEMNHISQDFFLYLGMAMAEYRRASLKAPKVKTRKRPSAALLAVINGSADVMSMWRRDRRYINRDGSPRVIPIKGRGASFETLARQWIPQVPSADVLKYICTHGGATLLQNDRVALTGQPAILTQRTPEMTAAWLLTQFRNMAQTAVYNASFAASEKGVGLFQRAVTGYLADSDFQDYSQDVRPRLQEVCEQFEAGLSLKPRAGPKKNAQACGVFLSLFRDTGIIG